MKTFIFTIFILFVQMSFVYTQNKPSETEGYKSVKHVRRGLLLSNHPLANRSFPISDENVPKSLSFEKRLRLSIEEFNLALKDKKDLEDYDLSQIYSFIGRSFHLLGIELQKENEKTEDQNEAITAESKKSFDLGVNNYFQAIEENNKGDNYNLVKDLVETVISSGDLIKAIRTINTLEKRVKMNAARDAVLLRMKGDIYFFMGREEDSATAYEEWIKRGNTSQFTQSESYKQKFKYLRIRTRHLINL